MHTGKGVFIVIEGTDGSGKGTQLERLAERLRTDGYDVATFDFPQYDEASSYFVRQYLNGKYGTADEIGPYTGSLFYALDRFEAGPKIKEAIEQGKVVLANRYVGSNMAHQGTKFRHAEERRGYFIWLDNLEFEMLGIPRPTLSIVLRVPAEIAQQLVDKKTARSYTDKKRDIHEADLAHLQKSVEVYTDMCQLFPKDFSLIEGTRDEQLLGIDEVHSIIWQKVVPLLPLKKSKNAASDAPTLITTIEQSEPAQKSMVQAVAIEHKFLKTGLRISDAEADQHMTGMQVLVRDCSSLLAQKLAQAQLTGYFERSAVRTDDNQKDGSRRYYIPDSLDAAMREQYTTHMDQLLSLHTEMVSTLTDHLQATDDTASPHEALRSILPVAVTSTVGLLASSQQLVELIERLLHDPLEEVRRAGEEILAEAKRVNPTLPEQISSKGDLGIHGKIAALAREYLPNQHTDATEAVQLVETHPRNELDLVADILYEHGSLPLKELRQISSRWSYEQKATVLEAYLGKVSETHCHSAPVLETIRYSWDLLCEYQASRELQHCLKTGHFEQQPLTPRYGYEVPKLIEDAGLVDTYEACFELSLKLYSLLQEKGYVLEAQYATLLGHKLRLRVTHSNKESLCLSPTTGSASYQKTAQAMREKMSEVHPILHENIHP